MDELKLALKTLLANQFVMYFKAHSYHWNVEGINFSQYHDFFAEIYSDVYGSIDKTAEYLRILDEYAPRSISEMYTYKSIPEDDEEPQSVSTMLLKLSLANEEVLNNLNKLFTTATAANEHSIADYAAARLDSHKKHKWMLRSSLKD
jgi:starvation-inducible DNA-binding protein